jgi:hypothetical protein
MPTVSNPEHRAQGTAARRAWNKLKHRQPNTDYPLEAKARLVCWAHISNPNAVLHTMAVRREPDGHLWVTYLQVSKSGETVRSMSRVATTAELERWFQHYPADRKLLVMKAVA